MPELKISLWLALVAAFILSPIFVLAAQADTAVKVFDGSGKLIKAIPFFSADYVGSPEITVGDINGDNQKELAVCLNNGATTTINYYNQDGQQLDSFLPFGSNITGGCYLSAGDFDGDKTDEIVATAGYGGGPQAKIFFGESEQKNFFVFDNKLRAGARILSADLGNDGVPEIIAFSNYNQPAAIALFGNDGHKITAKQLKDFNSNGLNLAVGDFNGDGSKEIAVAGGYGNQPEIYFFDNKLNLLKQITFSQTDFTGGLNLSAGDLNGDGKDELAVSESFGGNSQISLYNYDGAVLDSFNLVDGDFTSGVKTIVAKLNNNQPVILAWPERIGDFPDAYKSIGVDLSKQTLYRYQDGKYLDSYLISSGIAKAPTPVGDFKIYLKRPKVRMTWYYGPGNPMNYDLPGVPWVASFNGPYTIHGTYWHHNFGHPMSHGCVNMRTPEAKIVYDWVDIGTPVKIY